MSALNCIHNHIHSVNTEVMETEVQYYCTSVHNCLILQFTDKWELPMNYVWC